MAAHSQSNHNAGIVKTLDFCRQGGSMREDRRFQRKSRKGMYILPSLFTSGNIAAGYYAIMQSLQGSVQQPQHFNYAALAIGFAIPFDALDGRIARMTNTASDFGKELDSLADVITFGVAPSILAFTWGFHMLPATMDPMRRQQIVRFGAFICFLFLICGASRLARFNISANLMPKNPGRPERKYFVGMPIPAAAGVIVAVVHFFSGIPVPTWRVALIWMALVGLLGFLMVSTWRFWSGKEINLTNRHPFQVIVLLGLAIYAIVFFSQVVLLILAFVYMFSGIFARAAYSWQRRYKAAQRQPGGLDADSTDAPHVPGNYPTP
jgi:CDP-diacylglycerol---serine O-phosphatidyltransferase